MVRDAFQYAFPVKLVSDATSTLTKEEYEASMKALQQYGGTVTIGVAGTALSEL